MHDLSFFRQNLDAIALRLADRGFTVDRETFRSLDTERRAAITEAERLRADRNAQSQEIGKLSKSGADTTELREHVRQMGERMKELDQRAAELEANLQAMMASIPSVPHASVPA